MEIVKTMADSMLPRGNSSCVSTAWPAIIFAIFALVILVGIAFSGGADTGTRAWSFIFVLIFSLIWLAIIYWFCVIGYHAFGWFLLLLPLVLWLLWMLAYWLASSTVSKNCIAGDSSITSTGLEKSNFF